MPARSAAVVRPYRRPPLVQTDRGAAALHYDHPALPHQFQGYEYRLTTPRQSVRSLSGSPSHGSPRRWLLEDRSVNRSGRTRLRDLRQWPDKQKGATVAGHALFRMRESNRLVKLLRQRRDGVIDQRRAALSLELFREHAAGRRNRDVDCDVADLGDRLRLGLGDLFLGLTLTAL